MSNIVAMENKSTQTSLLRIMAEQYSMDAGKFASTVKSTCMPNNVKVTEEQFAAFLLVANKYGLNPITKEIYAFPTRGGGIQPIVGIDGWMNLINSQPSCDGMQFEDHKDSEGKLTAITCRIYRKDRSHPTEVTEYMSECNRGSDTWTKWPARMLRHKAAIQCARYAFGFAGIIDTDEAERSPEVITTIQAAPPPPKKTIEAKAIEVEQEEPSLAQFFAEFEAAISQVNSRDDIEQIIADMDVERICADDMDVIEKITQRRIDQLESI